MRILTSQFQQRAIVVIAIMAVFTVCATAQIDAGPQNADFEQDSAGQPPVGWIVPQALAQGGWQAELTDEQPSQGRLCAKVSRRDEFTDNEATPFGNLLQPFDASRYRGRRIRFSAAVRVESDDAAAPARAQLWLRADSNDGTSGFFDNMHDRPIKSPDWGTYSIVGDISNDTDWIYIGMMVFGSGTAWLDDVKIEVLGESGAGDEPPRALSARGMENLVALARVFGYVRYFHPSDEAANADWNRIAIEGVRQIEAADTDEALASSLAALVVPFAPTASFWCGDADAPLAHQGQLNPADGEATSITGWQHLGVGPSQSPIYNSLRRRESITRADHPRYLPAIGSIKTAQLTDGVSCAIPIVLYADKDGTLPRVPAAAPPEFEPRPPGWIPSGDDRATRLAGVVIAWNIFQHFYPYFDVVETDWDAVLRQSLEQAALCSDTQSYSRVLQELTAQLHDGHARVWHRMDPPQFTLPFAWDWVEGELVITYAPLVNGVGPLPGDVVVSFNGQAASVALAQQERLVSGATPGWRRFRALQELAHGTDQSFTMELRRGDDFRYTLTSGRIPMQHEPHEPRPEKIAELQPGIWYVDLDQTSDADFNEAVDDLAKAEGIVFDLRGYPGKLSTVVIAHLIDEPVTCAQWLIPRVTLPDREGMRFNFSNWTVTPIAPRFTRNIAFITDGRAISYAETYLGIIEHYKLAEIVGSATAGTNGNVNSFILPSGHTLMFTGMKVLKHDGSQHHGIGILPTVPMTRTIAGVAAGRDELLEKAIEVVAGGH